MKSIVIITKSYPYAKTEAFLESEIEILSKYFNKIIVCPTIYNEFERSTPNNVHVNSSFLINKKLKIKALFLAFFKGIIFKYFIDHRRKIKSLFDIKSILRYASYEVHYNKCFNESDININNSIVYSYWFSHAVNAIQRYKEKNGLDFKLITRAHRWDIYEDFGIFPYREKTIKAIDFIYSISDHGKKYLENRYDNSHKIKVSRLGVFDNEILNKVSKENEFIVLSVSQITSRKRPLLFLDSVVSFAKKNSRLNVVWVHFGTGLLEDELKVKIKELSIPNLKIDLKGYVLNTDIYKFYEDEKIDVFMNLSESEGVPVSIMEAQSYGVPVVATDVGGTSEIVFESVGVLLSPNPRKAEVLEALTSIERNKFNRNTIKKSWNERSNANINYTNFAKGLIKL